MNFSISKLKYRPQICGLLRGRWFGIGTMVGAKTNIIVFCVVHFICETAEKLSLIKNVPIRYLKAGCYMADSYLIDAFKAFIK